MFDMNLFPDRPDNNIDMEIPEQAFYPPEFMIFPQMQFEPEVAELMPKKEDLMENYYMPTVDMESFDPSYFAFADPALFYNQDPNEIQKYVSNPVEYMTMMGAELMGFEPPVPHKYPKHRNETAPEARPVHMPVIPFVSSKQIGTLTPEERKLKIERYLEKRQKRNFGKKVSYACRKRVADSRIRIKGRFVTKAQAEALKGLENSKNNVSLPLKTHKS